MANGYSSNGYSELGRLIGCATKIRLYRGDLLVGAFLLLLLQLKYYKTSGPSPCSSPPFYRVQTLPYINLH